jgi:hypothetical protein
VDYDEKSEWQLTLGKMLDDNSMRIVSSPDQ